MALKRHFFSNYGDYFYMLKMENEMTWIDVIKLLIIVDSIQKNSYYHKRVSACIMCNTFCKTVTNLCLQISVSAFGPSTVMSTGNRNTSEIQSRASGCSTSRERQQSHTITWCKKLSARPKDAQSRDTCLEEVAPDWNLERVNRSWAAEEMRGSPGRVLVVLQGDRWSGIKDSVPSIGLA